MNRTCLIYALVVYTSFLNAQVINTATIDTSGGEKIGKLHIGGLIDTYYSFSSHVNPYDQNIPYFVSSNRHNEFAINLAYLDVRYNSGKYRARLVPGFGTYMQSNYSSEPLGSRNLVEANVGYQISLKRNIWIDVGILGSPFTNESAVSKDHLMYTRSLAPEYVPYYLSGIKLSVPLSKKVTFNTYLLNGWQQIVDINESKSLATQMEYKLNDYHLINWNTYVGSERRNGSFGLEGGMRYFTDLYWIFDAGKKWNFTSCAYIGLQEEAKSKDQSIWWQANFISRYKINSKFSLSARVEYFSDPSYVMLPKWSANPWNVYGAGICANWLLSDHFLFRVEYRNLNSQQNLFYPFFDKQMHWATANMTVWF